MLPDPGPPEEDELYEMYMSETNMAYRVQGEKLVPVKDAWGQLLKHSMLSAKHVSIPLLCERGAPS